MSPRALMLLAALAASLMAIAQGQYTVGIGIPSYTPEGYVVLRGSGTNETANGLAKASDA